MLTTLGAMAQGGNYFHEGLAVADSLSGARATVTIHPDAQGPMEKYYTQTQPRPSFRGYRIRIFASHTQSARTDAEAAIELFKANYNVPVYFAYENPYFLVTCGNCLTNEEALMLLAKVRIHFPKAFIVTSDIPAEALTTKPVIPTPEEQSEEGETSSEEETSSEGEISEEVATPNEPSAPEEEEVITDILQES